VQVPAYAESSCPLADFLATQDPDSNAFVALAPDGTACGLAAVTTAVDTSSLLESFDLITYDGLMPSEQFSALLAEAERLALKQKLEKANLGHPQLVVCCRLPRGPCSSS
jgi:hypothetical protein